MTTVMKPQVFAEANKIWQVIARDASVKQADYTQTRPMRHIPRVGDYYNMVLNLPETTFEQVSDRLTTVLGYAKDQVTVPFFISLIHPEDQHWFLNFENRVKEFYRTLRACQVPDYTIQYDYRIRKQNGDYIRILQQITAIEFEGENKIVRTYVMHTDITHIKPEGRPVLSFIGLNGRPSYINVEVKNVFAPEDEQISRREKEILELLIEGCDSKTIAARLYISKQTVDTHRRNLLKKTHCENTALLIASAIRKGWV
jgi:DNA-binding CsgD family transcriptional regulator